MDRLSAQLIPGRSDNRCIRILLPDHGDCLIDLFLRGVLRPGENDCPGALNLVVIELAKVLHVHLYLLDIGNCHKRADLQIAFLRCILDRAADVRQLADAGRLDDDMIRVKLLHDLLQGLRKVPHQAAADAAGIHLGNIDAGFLQKPSVNPDLAELIFNQDYLLSCKHITDQFLNQRRLAGPEESRNNINLCHFPHLKKT